MNITRKNLMKFAGYLGGTALAVSALIGVTAQEAKALWITTSQGDYNVGILYASQGSNSEVVDILDNQDWWGDRDFAAEVAVKVGDSFGWDGDEGNFLAAFSLTSDGGGVISQRYQRGGGTQERIRTDHYDKRSWLVEVPTPAAVLPSIIGMGFSAIRKRKITASEEA